MTEANKKKQRHNRKYIPIVKFTIDMKSSIKYNCISDACDNNNYDYSTIKNVVMVIGERLMDLYGSIYSSGGYYANRSI